MKKKHFFIACLFTLLLSSCVDKTPLTKEQEVYVGHWQAMDGTYFEIFLDGTGNVKKASKSITGGAVNFRESGFEIGLFGISESYNVTEGPVEKEGYWMMVANGNEYRKKAYDY